MLRRLFLGRRAAVRWLWLITAFVILFRWGTLYQIERRRALPIEVDDAFSYLMQARMLEVDPGFQSPLLASFADLAALPRAVTPAEVEQNRLYHRLVTAYHLGHALLLRFGRAVSGLDYTALWWVLAFGYNLLLPVGLAFLLHRVGGPRAAAFAIGAWGMSLLLLPHQLTAAPREIAILTFVWALLAQVRAFEALARSAPAAGWLGLAGAAAFLCASVHSLGVLLAGHLGLIGIGLAVWGFPAGKRLRPFLLLGLTLGVAVLAAVLLPRLLGTPTRAPTPITVLEEGSFREGASRPVRKLASILLYLVGQGADGHDPSGGEILAVWLLFLVGFLGLVRRRSGRTMFLALGGGAVVLQLALTTVHMALGEDTTFERYYYTFSLAILCVGVGYGLLSLWTRFAGRRRAWILTALFVALVSASLGLKAPVMELVAKQRARDENFHSPEPIVRALQDRIKPGACVIVEGEVALYSLLLYGDYSYPVAYNGHCSADGRFRNNMSDRKCTLLFLNRRDACPTDVRYRVILEARPFSLAETEAPSKTRAY